MVHRVSDLFSPAEYGRITTAIQEAESKTSGEIVPYVVDRSDEYEVAEWRSGALWGILALTVFVVLHTLTAIWLPLDLVGIVLVTFAAVLLGMGSAKYLSPVKRFFAGEELMERRVSLRAAQAFVAEEVFKTRDRTGILIFLSVLEHRVLVMGDAGINAKVEREEWSGVVETIVGSIRSGKPADGLVKAIGMCGMLLQKKGVQIRSDDRDELPDTLRVKDR